MCLPPAKFRYPKDFDLYVRFNDFIEYNPQAESNYNTTGTVQYSTEFCTEEDVLEFEMSTIFCSELCICACALHNTFKKYEYRSYSACYFNINTKRMHRIYTNLITKKVLA